MWTFSNYRYYLIAFLICMCLALLPTKMSCNSIPSRPMIFDHETGQYFAISDQSLRDDPPLLLPQPDPRIFPPETLALLAKRTDDPMPGWIEFVTNVWTAFSEFGFNWSRYPLALDYFYRILCSVSPIQVMHSIAFGMFLCFLRLAFNRLMIEPYSRMSGLSVSTTKKVLESIWRAFWYLVFWLLSLKIVVFSGTSDFIYPLRIFKHHRFEVGYFDIPTPMYSYILYTLQLGFYCHSIWSLCYLDTWRKDSYLLMFHHLVTIILIEGSMIFRFHRVGTLVIFMHDLCDVFLELAKVNVYMRKTNSPMRGVYTKLGDLFFFLFGVSWFVFRLYWFPLKVLYATSWGLYISAVGRDCRGFIMFNSMLWLLLFMNMYWFSFIIRAAYRIMVNCSGGCTDVREEDDEDEDSSPPVDGDNVCQSKSANHTKKHVE